MKTKQVIKIKYTVFSSEMSDEFKAMYSLNSLNENSSAASSVSCCKYVTSIFLINRTYFTEQDVFSKNF